MGLKLNKKGQGEFHPAPMLPGNLTDKQSSTERPDTGNISLNHFIVNSGAHKSLLPAFMCPISAPQVGFEPASGLSAKDCFIQLCYRGGPSYDKESNNIDNLTNIGHSVN